MTAPALNRRILVVDDTASIHEDFGKILTADKAKSGAVAKARAAFLGGAAAAPAPDPAAPSEAPFVLEFALQGQKAFEMVKAAVAEKRPYALAFVDVRMPPGWDGIETIERLWKEDAELQTVICTAYSDYSWDQTIARLGSSDRLLILKKPFDTIEIRQLACSLTEKWNAARRGKRLVEDLQRAEKEARSYASSLETVHHALLTAKATAEKSAQMKTEFVLGLGERVHAQIHKVLEPTMALQSAGDAGPHSLALLDTIVDATFELTTTVDAAMDLTLFEAGRIELEPAMCAPADVIREAIETHRPRAQAREIAIELEIAGEMPDQARLDPARLKQVVGTLLGHAVASAMRGTIRVVVDLEHSERWECPWLRCEVRYVGAQPWSSRPGAPFEPFDGSPWALQLLLGRHLAQRMGGDLSIASAEQDEVALRLSVMAGDLARARMIRA